MRTRSVPAVLSGKAAQWIEQKQHADGVNVVCVVSGRNISCAELAHVTDLQLPIVPE